LEINFKISALKRHTVRLKELELCYYLSIRGVESPLAVVAGCKHLDQQGLAAVVRANYGVFAYKVVCA
jgi:hypothetical protein